MRRDLNPLNSDIDHLFVIRTGVDHVKQFCFHFFYFPYILLPYITYLSFSLLFFTFLSPPLHSSIDPTLSKSELVPQKNRSCINRFQHEREIWKGQKVRIYIFYDLHGNQIFWPAVWKFVFNFKVGKFKKLENLSLISKLENSRSLNVSNSFWVILKTLLHSVIELNVTIFVFYQTKIFLKFLKFMNFFSISKFYLQSPNSFSFYRHLQCLNLIWVRRSKNRIVNGRFSHIYN